jgi:hypothetical protein
MRRKGRSTRTVDPAQMAYEPRPEATLEGERAALAAAYRFILDCHIKEEGGCGAAHNDAKGGSTNDSSAKIKSSP